MNEGNKPTFNEFEIASSYVILDEAVFFFSPKLCDWLQEVRVDCQQCLELIAERKGQPSLKAREYAELQKKLFNHFRAMVPQFKKDLEYQQLTGTPGAKIAARAISRPRYSPSFWNGGNPNRLADTSRGRQ